MNQQVVLAGHHSVSAGFDKHDQLNDPMDRRMTSLAERLGQLVGRALVEKARPTIDESKIHKNPHPM